MKKIMLVQIWLILVTTLSAQVMGPDSSFHFSGYVFSQNDSIGLPNVHILNLCKGTGTVTAIDGSFALTVRFSDTLKFSCIGFENRFLLISQMILREYLVIYLKEDTVLMDELVVNPLGPRRFFRYKFLDLKLPEKVYDEYAISPFLFTPKEGEAHTPYTGITFQGPVQALYNVFNKKARTSRKLRKNRKKYSGILIPEKGDSLVWPEK